MKRLKIFLLACMVMVTSIYGVEGSQSNILWHNSTTGAVKFMPINNMIPEITLPVVDSSNTNLLPKGMGDFTRDGKVDILFHNQNSGNLRIWEMNGTIKGENIQVLGSSNINLMIAGVGDFDGDGDNDIATFNTNSGALRIWVMDGTVRVDNILVLTGANTNLVPRGAGDMDGDGVPDLVLRNNNSGAVRIWTMNSNFTRKGNEYIRSSSNTNLELRGVIDINDDGNNDILNYNTSTGVLRAWLMDGNLTITENAEIIQEADLDWSVRGGGADDSSSNFEQVAIGPQGGDFNLSNGINLSIPSDAVPEETTFQFRVLQKTEVVLPDNIFIEYDKYFLAGFEATPYGYQFAKPISVSVPSAGLIDSTCLPYELTLDTTTNEIISTSNSASIMSYSNDLYRSSEDSIIRRVKINADGEIEFPELSKLSEADRRLVVAQIQKVLFEGVAEDPCRKGAVFVTEKSSETSSGSTGNTNDDCHSIYTEGYAKYYNCAPFPLIEPWELHSTTLDVAVIPDNTKIMVGEIAYFTIQLTDKSGQPVTDFSIEDVITSDASVITVLSIGNNNVGIEGLSPGFSSAEVVIKSGNCQYKGWIAVDVEVGSIVVTDNDVIIEEGKQISIGVKLSNQPPVTKSILVTVLVSGDKDISAQPTTMNFNYSNWDTYQYFKLAAAKDKDFLDDTGYIVVMSADDSYTSEDISVKVKDNYNALRLAVEAEASRFEDNGYELHDEFHGDVPLTIDCRSGGLGTVKGSVNLPYHGSGKDNSCTYSIVGVAYVWVEGTVNCSKGFSMNLYSEVVTDYIFHAVCIDLGTHDTPNIHEYDDTFTLNPQNGYVIESMENWQDGSVSGTDKGRVELLPNPSSP